MRPFPLHHTTGTGILLKWREGDEAAFDNWRNRRLNVEETDTVLAVSPETIMRDWILAKAWLMREMRGEA